MSHLQAMAPLFSSLTICHWPSGDLESNEEENIQWKANQENILMQDQKHQTNSIIKRDLVIYKHTSFYCALFFIVLHRYCDFFFFF